MTNGTIDLSNVALKANETFGMEDSDIKIPYLISIKMTALDFSLEEIKASFKYKNGDAPSTDQDGNSSPNILWNLLK